MGLLDLLRYLRGNPSEGEEYEVTERARSLADDGRSEFLTPELLAMPGDRTRSPIVEYLEDDERPQYVFIGNRLLISDDEESLLRKHPTRKLVLVISDRRIIFVMGGRFADDLLEVDLDDVTGISLDHEPPRRFVVVEADADDAPMTFFAEVSIEPEPSALEGGIEFVRSRSG